MSSFDYFHHFKFVIDGKIQPVFCPKHEAITLQGLEQRVRATDRKLRRVPLSISWRNSDGEEILIRSDCGAREAIETQEKSSGAEEIYFFLAERPNNPYTGMQIYVMLPSGERLPLRVIPAEAIVSVKQKVQEARGFFIDQQRLTFEGERLANQHCLFHYDIREETTLLLEVRERGSMKIYIMTGTNGTAFAMMVNPSDTIDSVKEKISSIDGTQPRPAAPDL